MRPQAAFGWWRRRDSNPGHVDEAIAIRLQTDASFPMDLLVKRPSEVAERSAMNDTFIRSVLENGEVLYE